MKFLGLDPGVHGGCGKIWTDANLGIMGYEAFAFDAVTPTDIARFLRTWATPDSHEGPVPVVLIEKQGTRPTDARPGLARLHHQAGSLHGMLLMGGIRYEEVAPGTWQKTFKLLQPKGTPATVKKNKHKERAARLFPEVVMTHSVADALLIAEHARLEAYKGVNCG